MKIRKPFTRQKINFFHNKIIKKILLNFYSIHSFGKPGWLIYKELKYGGISKNIKRLKVSPKDPRTTKKIQKGGMMGGDRMLYHGYAKKYAQYLSPYIKKSNIVLAEVGILQGVGLAIWCDLFSKGKIIGFDIDLSHIKNNMDNLKKMGAFKKNKPELYDFDQFQDNTNYVKNILKDSKIDICIDDGLHSDESILTTLKSMTPHLSKKFIYIIEDNNSVYNKIPSVFPECNIDNKGELTILTRK
tara:strand:- start:172 stop:903 length:732 start_codon:yes stop_codon:yes gene_type:complete